MAAFVLHKNKLLLPALHASVAPSASVLPVESATAHSPLPATPTLSPAADYTNTFRSLSSIGAEPGSEEAAGGMPPALAEALGPLDEVREPFGSRLAWVCRWTHAHGLPS